MRVSRLIIIWLGLLLPLAGWSEASKIDAAPPIVLSPQEAVRQGSEMVASLLNQRPEPVTNTGVLRIRDRNRKERELNVVFTIRWAGPNTISTYQAREPFGTNYLLEIVYRPGTSNEYLLIESATENPGTTNRLERSQTMVPFAGSDFWVADLGLEFLHWPVQLLVRKEMRRGQACSVLESLESIEPQPTQVRYSRVISWIDNDSGGIVHADAYDARGKILKQFSPTDLQKVEGQYQVQQMEMLNRQTGSRSIIEFNLK